MQVSRIKILNIMGLEQFVLEPGKFTRIKAPNAAGKTSLATAIASVAKGGAHEARLLRNGATEGQIVIEIDDAALSLEKRVKAGGSDVAVRDESGKKATSKPVAMIQELLNLNSVNPISFFTADREERKKILLKAMPVQADPVLLEQITRQKVSATGNAWDVIAKLYQQLEQERRDTNRAAKEKRNTINQIELALPQKPDAAVVDMDGITAELHKVDAIKDQKIAAIDKKLSDIRAKHTQQADIVRKNNDAEADKIREQIRALEAQLAQKNRELNEDLHKLDLDLQENERKAADARTARTNEWREARGALDLQMKSSKAVIEAEARIKERRETIETMGEEAVELENASKSLTESMDALEAYKGELMSSLPVPGMELRGDDILVGGVVWENLNEARRMQIAFEVAKLQVGKCPFMFVDGAQRLDHKSFKLFEENALASGVQCVTFEVDRDPEASGFTVEVSE